MEESVSEGTNKSVVSTACTGRAAVLSMTGVAKGFASQLLSPHTLSYA